MMTAITHAMMKIFLRLQNKIRNGGAVKQWAAKSQVLHLLFWYSCACKTSENKHGTRLLVAAMPCHICARDRHATFARAIAMQAVRTRVPHLHQLLVAVFNVIFRQGYCAHPSRLEMQQRLC
jgi:hypothetical protein